MTRPVRLRLSRAKGFDLQAASRAANGLTAAIVARPGPFGNPFTADLCREAGFRGDDEAVAARCVAAFGAWLGPNWRAKWDGAVSERKRAAILEGLDRLRGRNLACWCRPDAPCHADVLLKLANE